MIPEGRASFLIRIRNALSYSLLTLAALCEAYSAAAIALDGFAASWYRTLGWFLFVLPGALVIGLFLLYADRGRLGFCLSATSLSLYSLLVVLDAYLAPSERGDWIFEIAWVAFCALGIAAAKSLMSGPVPANPTDAAE
jgi:hypothetical protein